MEKFKFLLTWIAPFALGFSFCVIVDHLWYVKKNITITLDGDRYTFESNVNKEGDRFFIIMNKDTVGTGIVVDGKWR